MTNYIHQINWICLESVYLPLRVRRFQSLHYNICPVVVQLLSRVHLFATLRTAACQASLSFTISWSFLKFRSTKPVIPCKHLILYHPLLLLPSIFPSIRVFSNESALHIRWPTYWSFSFSISPSNEYSGLISFRTDRFGYKVTIPCLGAGFILTVALLISTVKIHIHDHHHTNTHLQMKTYRWEEKKCHSFSPKHWKLHYLFMTPADGVYLSFHFGSIFKRVTDLALWREQT